MGIFREFTTVLPPGKTPTTADVVNVLKRLSRYIIISFEDPGFLNINIDSKLTVQFFFNS